MSCDIDRSVSMQGSQTLDDFVDLAPSQSPGSVESVVNFTVRTLWIAHLISREIDDPVLDVAGSSKSKDDSVEARRKARKALEVSYSVAEAFDVEERVAAASGAGPGIDGGEWFIGDAGHVGHFQG